MINRAEGFGKVHCHRHGASRGTILVEPRGYLVGKWQERSGSGVSRTETMLGIWQMHVRRDAR